MQTDKGTIARQTDRQTYRLTERKGQAGWQTDSTIHRLTDGQTGTEAGRYMQAGRQAGWKRGGKQTDAQTERQTDRHAVRHTSRIVWQAEVKGNDGFGPDVDSVL